MPEDLAISYDEHLRYSVGYFGEQLLEERLVLPQALEQTLKEGNIYSVSQLFIYLVVFPSFFSSRLKWDVEDVMRARKSLEKLLVGTFGADPIPKYDFSNEDST